MKGFECSNKDSLRKGVDRLSVKLLKHLKFITNRKSISCAVYTYACSIVCFSAIFSNENTISTQPFGFSMVSTTL